MISMKKKLVPRAINYLFLITLLMTFGCVTDSFQYKWDKPQKARAIGRKDCDISLPLTDEEVFQGAKRNGIYDSADSKRWLEFKAQQRDGDEIRYVACESVGKDKVLVGIDEFVLLRGNTIVANVFSIIID